MQSTIALESSVLVLNKFFAAIHIVNVKRAFTMLCKESAEVISVDDGQYNSYDFTSWIDFSAFKRNVDCRMMTSTKASRQFRWKSEYQRLSG